MPNICVITVLLAAISWATLPSPVRCTYCAFLDRNRPHEAYETIPKPGADTTGLETVMYQAGKGQIQADNVTIRCQDQNHYCYSLWGVDANTTQNVMIMQGCWDHADADECEKGSCISNRSDTKFCCCHGDLCNLNVTDAYVPTLYDVIRTRIQPPVDYVKDEAYRIRAIVIALTSVFASALAIAVTFLVYRVCLARAKDLSDLGGERAPSPGVSPPPSYHSQELQVDECIVRGRYGQIWRSSLDGETVAVKILSPQQEKHFLNERDIYNLPFMDHSSLLAFYGSETRLVENAKQYWLVLEYLPYGSLSSYLKNNVIDWSTLCKMCFSTASGLAHLHTDIAKGELVKPVIAHRDVTSRNVLVREDMTCCLADFGFALQLKGTRMDVRETEPSLTDVGTLRYMSPEALDGAVNLRDCESSLKQIDVYALGLVVWEIATRCSDLYQGLRVPDYQLPFSVELGESPTIEDMQLFVSRHKLRPAFPDVWKDSNQAIRLLKETIEECWDQDAEARLTAMCVQERCLDMAALWQVKYRNVLPMSHQGLSDRAVVQRNLCTSPGQPGTSTPTSSDKNANLTATSPAQPYTPGYSNTMPMVHNRDYSTLASLGQLAQLRGQLGEYQRLRRPPSYSTSTDERSTDTVITLLSPSISDHYLRNQGRNTVVERNTHKRSDEDMTYDGNAIIDSARPAQNAGKVTSIFLDSQPQPIAVGETEALVENDGLRQPPEIPHLQNQIPYHQNQIGPGQSRQTTATSMPAKRQNQPGRFSLRHIKTALNSLFPKKKATSNVTNLGLMASPAAEHPDKCNLNNPRATSLLMDEVSPLETSVSLINGAAVVAPLMTSSQSSDMTSSVPGSEESYGGSEPAQGCQDKRLASLGRPSSLSLDSCNSNSRELKTGDRIKYRIKTPAYHPNSTKRQGRFSLYDDRMMDNVDNASRDNHVIHEKRKTSISLQQFDMVVNDQLNNNVA